jgi:ketosteroid isomerase-like protein
MLALADTAIEWLTVEGSRVAPETVGRAALEGAMTRYFAQLPSARSVAESVLENGPFVVVRERAEWTARDGRSRAQRSIAVYEVRAGRVRRVWYYPVVR